MLLSRRRVFLILLLLTPNLLLLVLYNYASTAHNYLNLTSNYLSHWPIPSSPPPPLSSVNDIFDRPYTSSDAIRSVCTSVEWNPDLVFTCNYSHGAVAIVRNSILRCVLYALHAGAAMTLPRLVERDATDIAHVEGDPMKTAENVGMEVMFDVPHFVESLALSCPQLRLFNSTSEIPSHANATSIFLLAEAIAGPLTPLGKKLEFPEQWRGSFDQWLAKNRDTPGPVVVELGRSFIQYPIYSDSELFALDFGRILKFKKEVRVLATTVLKNMIDKYELHVDPWAPVWLHSLFGVHLRTERDALQAWPIERFEFSKYAVQSQRYIVEAVKLHTSLIYVASGDKQEITRFSADARTANMTVTAKHDLLYGEDLSELEAMTFDQQALVDFLVLLKSQEFVGVGHSAFAWNVALWRHVFAVERDHLNAGLMKDELSEIVGSADEFVDFAACLWP